MRPRMPAYQGSRQHVALYVNLIGIGVLGANLAISD